MIATETIQDLRRRIQEARSRGDGVEVARLRLGLPLSVRDVVDPPADGRRGVIRPGGDVRLTGYDTTTTGAELPAGESSQRDWPKVTITKGLLTALDGFDGLESGGYVFGTRDEHSIHVNRYVEAQLEEGRTSHSVQLDLDRGLQIWDGLDSSETLIGCLHWHPPTGETLPSAQDVSSWKASSQAFGRPWVGIVVREADTFAWSIRGRWQESKRFESHVTLADGNRHRSIVVEEI